MVSGGVPRSGTSRKFLNAVLIFAYIPIIMVGNKKAITSCAYSVMGDVTGGQQFTYRSLDDYRILASALRGGHYTEKDRRNLPYSVFMSARLPAFFSRFVTWAISSLIQLRLSRPA